MKRLYKIKSSHPGTMLRSAKGRWQAIMTDGTTTIVLDAGQAPDGSPTVVVDTAAFIVAHATGGATATTADTCMIGSIPVPLAGLVEDYPSIPDTASALADVSAADLRTAALSADSATGTARDYLLLDDGYIVATDTKRMTAIQSSTPQTRTLLHAGAATLLSKRAKKFYVGSTETHVVLTDGTDTIIHRMAEHKFPDWLRVIAGDYAPALTVDSALLRQAVDRARISTKSDQIVIDRDGRVYGHVTGCTIPITKHERDVSISFTWRYIAAVCKSIEGTITMSCISPKHPGIFRDADKRVTVVVTPMSDPPNKPNCPPLDAETEQPRKRKRAPTMVEIIPDHVWSSPEMAAEVRSALKEWGIL